MDSLSEQNSSSTEVRRCLPSSDPGAQPDSVCVRVEALLISRQRWLTSPSGEVVWFGWPLRSLRERFGGDEGEMTDPWGCTYRVSLAQWADADPDETCIDIAFIPDEEYTLKRDLAAWRDVPRSAWFGPEALVELGFARARVVMLNDAGGGPLGRRCRRARAIGRQILPTAHACGVRHLALEDVPREVTEAINQTGRLPQAADGVLQDDDMRALLQDALGLGWTLWGFAADRRQNCSTTIDWAYAEWLLRTECANLDAVLAQLGEDTKLLLWYDGASMTLWGPHYHKADTETLESTEFVNLSWEQAFVIDQTATVALYPESQWYCEGLANGLKPILDSFGGTAGILHEDAGSLRFSPIGCHAFLLSTDNAVE
ncbi:MAG: hypothetical protein M3N47_10580 [Chloroflexota bacterium]|nr:hypothetical protein [Chloroflexota bacterium]